MIKGTTKLLGVIGDPIEHSFSPVMHNAALTHLQADYVYLPFAIKPENLSRALKGFEAIAVRGFNVTIPHKQAIIPLLQEITPEAKMIGAVNTVLATKEGWLGTNTDYLGFIAPLTSLNLNWHRVTPFVLGLGGAARAVIVGCYSLGCREIHVFGRNPDKLGHFAQSWANTPLQDVLNVHSWDQLEGMVSQSQLLVNTTPVGMYPDPDNCPLGEEIIKQIATDSIVYDLIYNPSPTLLLKKAQAQGALVIDGLEMLVQQGAKALTMWLDREVPVKIMREALLDFLQK